MSKKYFTKQLDENDCGPASISMLIKSLWNVEITLSQLKVILSTNKNGTSFLGMKKGLERMGIEASISKCVNTKEVLDELQYPCIAQLKGTDNHFVTLFKATKGYIYIGNPAKNQIEKMKKDKFLSVWIPFVLEVDRLLDSQKLNSHSFTDSEQSNSILKSFYKIKKYIITSWILTSVIYLLTIYLAGMFSTYFDVIIPNKAIGLIGGVTVVYLLAVIVQFILGYINSIINVKSNNAVDKSLIKTLVSKFFAQNYMFTEQFESGELITRFSNISAIRTRYQFFIQILPIEALAILITLVILFNTNVYLSLLTFIPVIIFFLLVFFSKDYYENSSYNLYEKQEYLNTELIEAVDNTESIKNYNISAQIKDKINSRLEEVYSIKEKFLSFDNLQRLIKESVLRFFNVCLFAFGSYLIINNNLASGMLLMFNSLTSNVFNPFVNLTTLQATLQQGRVATLRYEDIVKSLLTDSAEKVQINNQIQKILIQNLYFSFEPNNYILKDLNLEMEKGEKIALVGGSGSGKSTIAKLLAGYYSPDKGRILLNEVDINDIDQNHLLEKVLYIPQDIQIFNDTILNNILLYRDIEFDVVKQTSTLVGFDKVVDDMPEGYNTVIGSKGVQLSMGQQQMLNITRYLLASPDILILDEITNGLDFVRRNRIKQILLDTPITVVFITHDLDLATSCDKICALNNAGISIFNPNSNGYGDIEQKLVNYFQ